MPRYDYLCPACRMAFTEFAGREDRFIQCCSCGSQAERRPFSGAPYLKGDTVARSIPEEAYRYDAEKREFQASWGGNDRSIEMLRKNTHEDPANGWKMLDTKGMNNA